jgi:ribonucleases P/MRP protein subunit RPP40
MLHGKKGFERIVWAFKNVLNHSVAWLFHDLRPPTEGITPPIDAFQPIQYDVKPSAVQLNETRVPAFPDTFDEDDYEDSAELLEWVTLVTAESPRTQQNDRIDPYLSRYEVPQFQQDEGTEPSTLVQHLTKYRWHGFIPATFAYKVMLAALKASGKDWVAFSAVSFHGTTYTVLKEDDHAFIWEYSD